MSKGVFINFRLAGNKLTTMRFNIPTLRKYPDYILDIVNILSTIMTAIFFFTVFISHILRFSTFADVDLVILIYVYIIMMSFLQFSKLIFGGDKFFPQVSYDLGILLLSPILMFILLLNNTLGVGIFGALSTWSSAAITLISIIIFTYIIAINFSDRASLKRIQLWSVTGLSIAGIASFIYPTLVVGDVNILIALLLPVFILRSFDFIKHRFNISFAVLSIIGGIIILSQNFLNNNLMAFDWRIYDIFFVFDIVFVAFAIYKIIYNWRSICRTITQISGTGTVEISIPRLDIKDSRKTFKLVAIIFFLTSLYLLFRDSYIINILDTLKSEVTISLSNKSIQQLLLGIGTSSSKIYVFSLIDTFGLIGGGVLLLVPIRILLQEINKINVDFNIERLSFILAQLILLITSLFYQLSVVFVFAQFMFIAFSMISARTKDFNFGEYDFLAFSFIRNKKVRRALNLSRVVIITLTLAGTIILISSLPSIIDIGHI